MEATVEVFRRLPPAEMVERELVQVVGEAETRREARPEPWIFQRPEVWRKERLSRCRRPVALPSLVQAEPGERDLAGQVAMVKYPSPAAARAALAA